MSIQNNDPLSEDSTIYDTYSASIANGILKYLNQELSREILTKKYEEISNEMNATRYSPEQIKLFQQASQGIIDSSTKNPNNIQDIDNIIEKYMETLKNIPKPNTTDQALQNEFFQLIRQQFDFLIELRNHCFPIIEEPTRKEIQQIASNLVKISKIPKLSPEHINKRHQLHMDLRNKLEDLSKNKHLSNMGNFTYGKFFIDYFKNPDQTEYTDDEWNETISHPITELLEDVSSLTELTAFSLIDSTEEQKKQEPKTQDDPTLPQTALTYLIPESKEQQLPKTNVFSLLKNTIKKIIDLLKIKKKIKGVVPINDTEIQDSSQKIAAEPPGTHQDKTTREKLYTLPQKTKSHNPNSTIQGDTSRLADFNHLTYNEISHTKQTISQEKKEPDINTLKGVIDPFNKTATDSLMKPLPSKNNFTRNNTRKCK